MAAPARCRCGVLASVSHFCSALDHCWVSRVRDAEPKREYPNPDGEHLAANGKPIDGYPRQQA
jgi:hypothetical protein